MKQVALRLDDDLAAQIDQAAGQIPRERWIKNTLRDVLQREPVSLPLNAGADPQALARYTRAEMRAHPTNCKCGVCQALKGKR
jgi:hypothetical protein